MFIMIIVSFYLVYEGKKAIKCHAAAHLLAFINYIADRKYILSV
jgi:hypothetical protein